MSNRFYVINCKKQQITQYTTGWAVLERGRTGSNTDLFIEWCGRFIEARDGALSRNEAARDAERNPKRLVVRINNKSHTSYDILRGRRVLQRIRLEKPPAGANRADDVRGKIIAHHINRLRDDNDDDMVCYIARDLDGIWRDGDRNAVTCLGQLK